MSFEEGAVIRKSQHYYLIAYIVRRLMVVQGYHQHDPFLDILYPSQSENMNKIYDIKMTKTWS